MKVCIKCEKEKEYKHFFKSKKTSDGYSIKCKTCVYGYEPRLYFIGNTRTCIECKIPQHIDKFYRRPDSNNANSRRSICIECLKSKSRIEKYKRYGLSKEEYTKLITINDGRCHICNIPSKTYID